jgi:hypothetical protein
MALLDRMSLANVELKVTGGSTVGSIGITMSGAVRVIVAIEVCPTEIEVGAKDTDSTVCSGRTVRVPLMIVIA